MSVLGRRQQLSLEERLSLNIQIQIFYTDLHAFLIELAENLIINQGIYPLVIILLTPIITPLDDA